MMELQKVPQAPVLLALPPPQPVKKYELSSVSLSRSLPSLSTPSLVAACALARTPNLFVR